MVHASRMLPKVSLVSHVGLEAFSYSTNTRFSQSGAEVIISAVMDFSAFGVQFHPENSSKAGQRFLKRYIPGALVRRGCAL